LKTGDYTHEIDLYASEPGTLTGAEKNGQVVGQYTPNYDISLIDQRTDHRLEIRSVADTFGLEAAAQ